jgi:hypothetical protein
MYGALKGKESTIPAPGRDKSMRPSFDDPFTIKQIAYSVSLKFCQPGRFVFGSGVDRWVFRGGRPRKTSE